jgi:predicted RNase H-like nuclease (RuvC/YqgF family)
VDLLELGGSCMNDPITRAEHNEFVKRMEEEHHRINERLRTQEELAEQNNKLLISVERLATNMENMQKELSEQNDRVEVLEAKDGEMWRKAVGYLLSAVIGGFVSFIYLQLGM